MIITECFQFLMCVKYVSKIGYYPRTKICLKKFYVTHIHFKYMSSLCSYLRKNDYIGELLKLIVKPVTH